LAKYKTSEIIELTERINRFVNWINQHNFFQSVKKQLLESVTTESLIYWGQLQKLETEAYYSYKQRILLNGLRESYITDEQKRNFRIAKGIIEKEAPEVDDAYFDYRVYGEGGIPYAEMKKLESALDLLKQAIIDIHNEGGILSDTGKSDETFLEDVRVGINEIRNLLIDVNDRCGTKFFIPEKFVRNAAIELN
jgi:hypothetical protein